MIDYQTLHTVLLVSLLLASLGLLGLMVHTDPWRRKMCGGTVGLALLAACSCWSVFHGRWSGQLLGLGLGLLVLLVLLYGEPADADEESD